MPVKIITALVTVAVMAFASPALGQPGALEVKAAAELLTWKTITVGLHRSVNAVRDALDEARIAVGESADEILGRPAFTFAEAPTELDLVVLSVAELDFGPQGAALADIHERGIRIGLELCPEEVGPQLRLQYLNQPVGESLHVAMKPQRTYRDDPTDFTLANFDSRLVLLGGSARPDLVLPTNVKFVFVRRKSPEVASR
jgi:hypothetical protein